MALRKKLTTGMLLNLSEIRDLALQVLEAGSKTCNAKITQKIVSEPMLHGINF